MLHLKKIINQAKQKQEPSCHAVHWLIWLIFILTVYRAYQSQKDSTLIRTMYHDGSLLNVIKLTRPGHDGEDTAYAPQQDEYP